MTIKAAADSALSLCAFRAAGLDAGSGGTPLPTRLVVAPWGTHDVGSRGKVIVNDHTLSVFTANQKLLGRDGEVAGDFDHNTVEGTAVFAADKEPRNVASWGTANIEKGVGIVVTGLSYTPEGKAALEGGHYKDISPAVIRNKEGVVIGLHSFAFCRHGQIEGFTIEAAAATGALKTQLTALSASLQTKPPVSPSPSMKAAIAALLKLLGITVAADADDAAFEAALTEAAPKLEAMAKKPDAMAAEVTAEVTAFSVRLEKMEKADIERERAAIIAGAVAEGKVIALSAEIRNTCPLEVLKDHVAQLKPGVVPLHRTSPTGSQAAGAVEAFSAEDKLCFEKFGLTEEQVTKQLSGGKAAA